MSYIPMIDPETGAVDTLAIAQRAPLRASAEYGSPNYPPSYLRSATDWLIQRAQAESRAWRRDHNLPVDTEGLTTIMPYGKHQDGVRRSAF